jgi:hypothetical protein
MSFSLRDPVGTPVASAVRYVAGTRTVTLDPEVDLDDGATYTAVVSGARDLAGNVMPTTTEWSFTTRASPSCPCTLWSTDTVPSITAADDPNAVELGLKFQTAVPGVISGVRFYKGPGNAGPHVVNLWTGSGANIASVAVVEESASGWQQVDLVTPVEVSANTTYVVSYFAPSGRYAVDTGYFAASDVENPPLRALASSPNGGNGVYAYSGTSSFPTSSFNGSHYWVDVVFVPA